MRGRLGPLPKSQDKVGMKDKSRKNHWSEREWVTSVLNADAPVCPRRSVRASRPHENHGNF